MRLKTSWFKGELFKQNFRQVGWISLIYFTLLFFAVPLNIFMSFNQERDYYVHYSNVFEFGVVVQLLTLFVVPVLMAMFILRYLHQKDASDFIHSLPIKRHLLFWQQVGFGIVALWLPILINAGLTFLITQYIDVSSAFNLTDLGYWLITTLVMITFIFTVSLIVGVLTGITIIQGIFTYIILFLPVGFTILLLENINYAVIGLPDNQYILDQVYILSPFTSLTSMIYSPEQSHMHLLMYSIAAIVCGFIAQLIYQYRPAEAATQAIAFQKVKLVFIYSFTFCFTLIGGIYFALLQRNISSIFIGYLIFSIIGYFITQMIVHKTWRVFREWKEYGFFFIGFSILIIVIFADLTGYQNRIPDTEEIQSAYIVPNHFSYHLNRYRDAKIEGFSSEEEINLIREHHQELIDISSREDEIMHYLNTVLIVYQLENGREIIREYSYPEYYHEPDAIRSLYDTPTYQKYTQDVFYIDSEEIKELRFYSWGMRQDAVLTDREQIVELTDLLRKDLLEGHNDHFFGSHIDFTMDNMSQTSATINHGHLRAIEWLESHDLLDQVLIGPDQIESIVIARPEYFDDLYYYDEVESYLDTNEGEEAKIWIFNDPEEIKHIFDQAYIQDDETDYTVSFYLKGNPDPFTFDINQSMLPTEIIEQLN